MLSNIQITRTKITNIRVGGHAVDISRSFRIAARMKSATVAGGSPLKRLAKAFELAFIS